MNWRPLTALEIEQLKAQYNSADDWNNISVAGTFCSDLVHHCYFSGRVFIGEQVLLHHVGLLSNYMIGNGCVIRNVQEISFAGYHFGFEMHIRNEDGSHQIQSFPEMCVADAFLCSQVPSSHPLHQVSNSLADWNKASFGCLHEGVTVCNVTAVRNCCLEPYTVVRDATLLEDVLVHSSQNEPSHIGAGVIVRSAILGLSNVVENNTIVRNVVTGAGVELADGLRISHCVVGDNSHLSCCEVLHSLIFPFHEQHHNSSFLIASLLQGQSNVASGATLGSNHNGRKNDCELVAGRGFWPGLCTSVKFPSRFASYTLLAKGDYPFEINLKLPFSLLNNNVHDDVLEIMPAYWWMHNCFALRRNAEKFLQRDHRQCYTQHIHTQPIAPDTVQEIITALNLFLSGGQALTDGVEHSKREVRILKKDLAFTAYREMLTAYVYKTLKAEYERDAKQFLETVKRAQSFRWVCLGGQLVREQDAQSLLENPAESWIEMHEKYNLLWKQYEQDNKQYAAFVMRYLCDCKPTMEKIEWLMDEGAEILISFERRADAERKRDLQSEFRKSTTL